MSDLPLSTTFDRDALAVGIQTLADHGVYVGTSSWKYEGWLGKLYSRDRYLTRKQFSNAKFERECLAEFGETFSTVCVDAGYYRFPPLEWIQQLMEATPEHFLFTFKVTDEITARRFPNLPRHGKRAGLRNENFLNVELFHDAFLSPLEPWREKVGVLFFEFSHFYPGDFDRGRDFVDALDLFLAALPQGWRYGVEVRNRNLLQPDYFEVLQRHGVAHIFNQWTKMPDVGEQLRLPGSLDCAGHMAARFLLKQGRDFEDAVNLFSPYTAVKEPHEGARQAAAELVRLALIKNKRTGQRSKRLFLYVNNRLEGNSLETIRALIKLLDSDLPEASPLPVKAKLPELLL